MAAGFSMPDIQRVCQPLGDIHSIDLTPANCSLSHSGESTAYCSIHVPMLLLLLHITACTATSFASIAQGRTLGCCEMSRSVAAAHKSQTVCALNFLSAQQRLRRRKRC